MKTRKRKADITPKLKGALHAKTMMLNPGAVITEAGNASTKKTGDWKTMRPVIDMAKCTGCGICVKYCPDAALSLADVNGKKKVVVDYYHCKGCLICLGECPFKACTSEVEKRADTNKADFKKEGVC